MFPRHYSDEQLLAHLDGEISGWARRRLETHLASCWLCRARRSALEEQIHRLAEAFDEPGFPEKGWAARQVERFDKRLEACESDSTAASGKPASVRPPRRLYWAAAACAVALVVVQLFRLTDRETTVEVVAGAVRAEHALADRPVHQSFRVDLVREGRQRTIETGRLDVWSDPSGGRYSVQWRKGGELAFAIWKPKPGEEHWHGAPPEMAGPRRRLAALASQRRWRADLEELLIRWLASRRWQPVSIAGEVSCFINQDGVSLRSERFQQSGERYLRIVARRPLGDFVATLIAEFALRDHRPRLLRLRLEYGAEAAEVRLVPEQIESGPQVRLVAAVFAPRPSVAGLVPRPLPELPGRAVHDGGAAGEQLPLSPQDRADRELQVRYALHRIGACLGDPIEVEVPADGQVTVRGLVDEESRLEAIRQTLRELPYVRIEVRVAPGGSGSADDTAAGEQSGAGLRPRHLVVGEKVLIEEQLASWLRQSHREAELPARVVQLANDATLATAGVLAHAWAVRRLHAAFPAQRAAQLRPPARWILEDMLQDHLSGVRERAETVLHILEPILDTLGGPAEREPAVEGFEQEVEDLFRLAEETDRLSRGVFGLTRLNPAEEIQAPSRLMENLVRLAGVTPARATMTFRDAVERWRSRAARDDSPGNSTGENRP